MFYIQSITRGEGDFWQRIDGEHETVTEALEARDELAAAVTNAECCNYGPQYRVVDADGNVYEYKEEFV